MTGRQAAYAAPLMLSVLTCAVVLVLVWRRRHVSSAVRAFANSVLGQVAWGAGYVGELFAPTLAGKQAWDMLQVFPAYLVGLEAFRFALAYTGSKLLESKRAVAAVWALPALHMLVVYTNPLQGIVYYDAQLVPGPAFEVLRYSFTPLDQLGYGYLVLLYVATAVTLFRSVWRQGGTHRAQLLPVSIALSLPVVAIVLFLCGLTVLGQRDSAPYAFAVSSVIVAYTLLRRRLFDLNPIAYGAVIAATPEGVLVVDDAGRVVDTNPALDRLLKGARNVVGQPLAAAVPWATPALTSTPWQPVDIELSPELIVEARSAALSSASGQALGRVLTFQDVTLTRQTAKLLKQQNEALEGRVAARTVDLERANAELKAQVAEREQAERRVDASRKQLRDVLDQAFQLMGILELDGSVVHANRAALDMIGAELVDVVGKKFWDTPWWADPAGDRQTLKDAIERAARGELVRFSTTHRDRSGDIRHIDFSLKPVLDEHGRVTVLVPEGRDVSELRRADEQRRQLEQQLAQAQRVESLGRLAAGVAHDFNNLLTAILSNVELARMDVAEASPIVRHLDEIWHAGESAKALVRQLLVFARQPSQEVTFVDVGAMLEGTLRLLSRLLGEDVAIVSHLPSTPAHVRIDARQLEQVIVNLAVNARDAMPGGGTLRIDVELVGERPSGSVRVSVSDSGSGIPEPILARIFEPFFTTKPVGKGTGLGLAVAFEVVQQAGGKISVHSEPGRGSTFTLEFPEAAAQPAAPAPLTASGLPRGVETILFVEDQPEVSRAAQYLLRRLGYTVHAFRTGEEVLEAGDSIPRADLLFSDVVLPGISGPSLADKLIEGQPWLRVLFASGYHEDSLARYPSKVTTKRVLGKPFSMEELAQAVRAALEEPAS
jgi:PAS domain S-box-containing protein